MNKNENEIEIDFRDCIVFGGVVAVGYGTYLIYHPAAFLVVGALLIWIGRP